MIIPVVTKPSSLVISSRSIKIATMYDAAAAKEAADNEKIDEIKAELEELGFERKGGKDGKGHGKSGKKGDRKTEQ